MQKILNLFKFLKNMLWKYEDEERTREIKLNKKIDLRVSSEEYKVIQAYCNLEGLTISEYFRNLNQRWIERFIQDNS